MALFKKSEDAKTAKKQDVAKAKEASKRADYFRGVWYELKKVHWPTRNQLLTYTGVVLVSVAIIALLIWVVDSGLTFAMNQLLGS